ncbi:hypothetical protein R3P38DRAFT_3259306 [Favolaschia claudopus]|uniref:Uncharacterized protein n=1 Tax=Favolaschia claudopus TaxID=2862362 RepID=A0AAW0CVV1_9AGAR
MNRTVIASLHANASPVISVSVGLYSVGVGTGPRMLHCRPPPIRYGTPASMLVTAACTSKTELEGGSAHPCRVCDRRLLYPRQPRCRLVAGGVRLAAAVELKVAESEVLRQTEGWGRMAGSGSGQGQAVKLSLTSVSIPPLVLGTTQVRLVEDALSHAHWRLRLPGLDGVLVYPLVACVPPSSRFRTCTRPESLSFGVGIVQSLVLVLALSCSTLCQGPRLRVADQWHRVCVPPCAIGDGICWVVHPASLRASTLIPGSRVQHPRSMLPGHQLDMSDWDWRDPCQRSRVYEDLRTTSSRPSLPATGTCASSRDRTCWVFISFFFATCDLDVISRLLLVASLVCLTSRYFSECRISSVKFFDVPSVLSVLAHLPFITNLEFDAVRCGGFHEVSVICSAFNALTHSPDLCPRLSFLRVTRGLSDSSNSGADAELALETALCDLLESRYHPVPDANHTLASLATVRIAHMAFSLVNQKRVDSLQLSGLDIQGFQPVQSIGEDDQFQTFPP